MNASHTHSSARATAAETVETFRAFRNAALAACGALLFGFAMTAPVFLLHGGPLGTPVGHSRQRGHLDSTIAISPTDDTILFNAVGRGGRDLYLLKLADLSVTRIAKTPDYEVDPDFSPDGQRIVYAAGVPGDKADHIFTVGIDGTRKSQLTSGAANDASPRFSPDGQLIVFARDKTYNRGGLAANWSSGGVICVIGVDGTGERQLTPDDLVAFTPAFSQDGRSVIYFTADGSFSLPLDGSAPPKHLGPFLRYAKASPDGARIVYSDGKYSPDHELFIGGFDGLNRSKITTSDHGSFHPVFTRAGDRVYFLREEWPNGKSSSPKSSIWTVKTDGTGERQISDLSLFDSPTSWRPKRSP